MKKDDQVEVYGRCVCVCVLVGLRSELVDFIKRKGGKGAKKEKKRRKKKVKKFLAPKLLLSQLMK